MELFHALVTNNDDPCKIGRVQIRVYGEHDDTTDNSTLPWAEVMQSASLGLIGGVGLSSVLKVGTWVYAVKIENTESRYLVLGVCTGVQGEDGSEIMYGEKGLSDFGQICITNDNLKNKGKNDKDFPYNCTVNPGDYLNSTVLRTESGIMIELNDSSSLIKITHPSGSIIQITDNAITLTSLKDINVNTKGDLNFDVKNNVNFNVKNDMNFNVEGDINYQINGDCTQSVIGNWDLKCNGEIRQFGYDNVVLNIKGDYNIENTNFNVDAKGGKIKFVDIITPRGIDLSSHVHSGVRRGDSNTDIPK